MTDEQLKKQTQADVARVLISLRHKSAVGIVLGGVPEGELYAVVLETDIGRWEIVRAVLLKVALVTIQGHVVRLTPKGEKLARAFEDALVKAAAEDASGGTAGKVG